MNTNAILMGKVSCNICGKKCKGEVLRVNEKYFHSSCFRCSVCKRALATGGFFQKSNIYYCTDDYHAKFGTKCGACQQYVHGDVVTALGKTFHQQCFICSRCSLKFQAGDKVSFAGSEYLCEKCVAALKQTPKHAASSLQNAISSSKTSSQNKSLTFDSRQSSQYPSSAFSSSSMRTSSPLQAPNGTLNGEEVFSPIPPKIAYTSSATGSMSGGSHSSSMDSLHRTHSAHFNRNEPSYDFGRFYKNKYLNSGSSEYLRHPLPTPQPKTSHFHRPHIRRPASTGRLHSRAKYLWGGSMTPQPINNKEPIRLSRMPAAKPPEEEKLKIERDDWPAPPAPAAILPEIMRRRRSSGKSVTDEDTKPEDPRLTKDIEYISKITPESGMAQDILQDLETARSSSPTLDPRSASRTPAANHEPHYPTRFISSMFASPSRIVDPSRRHHSAQEARTIATMPNYTIIKPGYTHKAKAATLPNDLNEKENIYRGYDYEQRAKSPHTVSSRSTLDGSFFDKNFKLEYYGLKQSVTDGHSLSFLDKKSLSSSLKDPPKMYAYGDLLITNQSLPRDVDISHLEQHLSERDFHQLFRMNREEFSRLATFKQNDIKRKLKLY